MFVEFEATNTTANYWHTQSETIPMTEEEKRNLIEDYRSVSEVEQSLAVDEAERLTVERFPSLRGKKKSLQMLRILAAAMEIMGEDYDAKEGIDPDQICDREPSDEKTLVVADWLLKKWRVDYRI